MEKSINPKNIDEYIAAFPSNVQPILEQVRAIVKSAAPETEEVISYRMPAFKLKGIVVYFGGHKNHIGLYPTASGVEAFKKEISSYNYSKGAIQFPVDKPLPSDLIAKIVKFRVKENLEGSKTKK